MAAILLGLLLTKVLGVAATVPTIVDPEGFIHGECALSGDYCKVLFMQKSATPELVTTKVEAYDADCKNYPVDYHGLDGVSNNKTIDLFYRWENQDVVVKTAPADFPAGIEVQFGGDDMNLDNMHCHLKPTEESPDEMCWISWACPHPRPSEWMQEQWYVFQRHVFGNDGDMLTI